MGFRSSQQCVRRGESTDSKTMIPLIQNTVEKPVTGVWIVWLFVLWWYICAMVVTTVKGTDARLALGSSCESARQGITGRSLVNCLPPLDDLGKVCAKFNGRSRGFLVSTK